jgi:hypothetical protein
MYRLGIVHDSWMSDVIVIIAIANGVIVLFPCQATG